MPEIVLAAINARYLHPAFGLRCLLANLGPLRPRAALLEFDLQQRPVDMAERILALDPRIVGLGVYVWNATQAAELVALLKRIRPDLKVVLGGPEVSFEWEDQTIVRLADHVVPGEGDLAFRDLCARLLGEPGVRLPKILPRQTPRLEEVRLPYDEYSDEDLAHRMVYVEASRGCAFGCEFCLSALDRGVRRFDRAAFLAAMDRLLARGARHFKFVDRTFNLQPRESVAILDFFLERLRPGLFLHFEVVPDRLPDELKERLRRFPPGTLQLEVGVQTFHPEVAARIQRRQDYARLEANLRFLREETHAHLHADLIFGLPGETFESFGRGFDRLVALRPHEIQVGHLKRLRGAPISRHDAEWGMVWSPLPPYELLANRLLDFATVRRLARFARFWDLIGNSGQFRETLPWIWGDGSPFEAFLGLSDRLYARFGRHHAIALPRLMEAVFEDLVRHQGRDPDQVGPAMARDYLRPGRRDVPPFLQPWAPKGAGRPAAGVSAGPPRQRRHQLGAGGA
ncbi:MAG: DUF4080 domain-containing protein [Verrucomicrobia bacterium]|nr:MAG: DUF4080 domain-containing protein [Verrucomicrobiota bacterium]